MSPAAGVAFPHGVIAKLAHEAWEANHRARLSVTMMTTAAAAAGVIIAGIGAAIPASASTSGPTGCVKIHLGMTPKQVTKALGSKGSYWSPHVHEYKYGKRTIDQYTRRWCKPGPAEDNRVGIVIYRGGVVVAYEVGSR